MIFSKGWNISHGLSTIQITSLVIFFILLAILITSFLMIWIYKTMLKNYIDAYQEATKIARNAVQVRLKRLSITVMKNQTSSAQEKHVVEIWKVRYKNLIENNFYNEINNMITFFQNFNYKKPNLQNLKRSAEVKKHLKEVSWELYIMFKEMDKILQTEFIQRDARIQVREVFNEVKKEAMMKMKDKSLKFNQELLKRLLENIENAMIAINIKLKEGMYGDSLVYQDKTSDKIMQLIRTLDLFETSEKFLNKTLPLKILAIKKNIIETMYEVKEKVINETKIQNCENQFLFYKTNIQNSVFNLDYTKAFNELSEISEVIINFETNIEFEEIMKMFIENNFNKISQIFQDIKQDYINGIKAIKSNEKAHIKLNKAMEFEKIWSPIPLLETKWSQLYDAYKINLAQKKKIDYSWLKNELIPIVATLSLTYKKMIEITRGIKTTNPYKNQIEHDLNSIKSIVALNENLSKKFARIVHFTNIGKQNDHILEKLLKIENIIHAPNFEFTEEEFTLVKARFSNLRSEALAVRHSVINAIEQTLIAEALILYFDRYANYINFETYFNQVMANYDNKDMALVINQLLSTIKQYQREKR
ncbi:hypothetical protein [Williamsoniiplasma lucivorax]|uniref:Septation ring formation regulator n=1 Tax=Williamsoniiplasma lucivorax TaxID=209274 RepID=A0A2S5RFR9_9MOLU|nr:hypothetical protein [Williamsoniiplasma lucivorax]PPE06137.1 hypothetical protein ELUCI_v1c04280 [Williamsoniiplasma lucivorax]